MVHNGNAVAVAVINFKQGWLYHIRFNEAMAFSKAVCVNHDRLVALLLEDVFLVTFCVLMSRELRADIARRDFSCNSIHYV